MATRRSSTPRSDDSVLGVPSLELVLGILERIPGTHSVAVWKQFFDGDYQSGTALRLDPSDFARPEEFALALLSYSLFRKYPGLPGSQDKAGKAIEKWLECEEACRETNGRIKEFRIGVGYPHLHEPFRLARLKIQKLLGPFRWSKPARYFDFGPGSTTRLPFRKRHPSYKYGEHPETTFDNLANAEAVIGLSPVWVKSTGGDYTDRPRPLLKIREESKVTTVPKDAFIDRVIAIEPDMNMYVQKGFGGFIRNRLRLVGVNLDDQSLNQILARSGSATGSLATIDLSSASDTVSYELVKELLPPDWFEALLSCRTHESRLPSGEVVPLQKFSAMGNGFTFELESLIFWALCSSVCTETIGREGLHASVYGDDIIVSVADVPAVTEILTFSGFTMNMKKSYWDGPYRESCGKHYFLGHDVTPITITKEISNVSHMLLLCNNLIRWSVRTGTCFGRNSSVRLLHRWLVSLLPPKFQRPKLPDGYGDGALIGSFDACTPSRDRRGWSGWRVSGILLSKQRYRRSVGVATLTASLNRLESEAGRTAGNRELPSYRGGVFCYTPSPNNWGSGKRGGDKFPHLSAISQSETRSSSYLYVSEWDFTVPKCRPSDVPLEDTRYKLGKVFIPEWCDIGPWAD